MTGYPGKLHTTVHFYFNRFSTANLRVQFLRTTSLNCHNYSLFETFYQHKMMHAADFKNKHQLFSHQKYLFVSLNERANNAF